MRHSNIMKLDSKGRVLIPIHIRKKMNASEGTDVMIVANDEANEIKLIPIIKNRNAELKFLLTNIPDSLAVVANVLANHHINILMSESRAIVRGKITEWNIIADTSKANNEELEKIKNELSSSRFVKNIEIIRR